MQCADKYLMRGSDISKSPYLLTLTSSLPPFTNPMPDIPEPRADPVRRATAPFDSDARADAVLCSCDGTHFLVSQHILSLASPVFADMFSLGGAAPNELLDGLPVVCMAEDAAALDLLLRWCYPIRAPPLGTSLARTWLLAAAMRKYGIDAFLDAVDDALRVHLASDPIGVLVIAVMLDLDDVTRKALRATLAMPLAKVAEAERPGLTDRILNILIRYYLACGAAASEVVRSGSFFPPVTIKSGSFALVSWNLFPDRPEYCTCAVSIVVPSQDATRRLYAPPFVSYFVDTARHALLHWPGMCAEDVASLYKMRLCLKCSVNERAYVEDMKKLIEGVIRHVNDAIDEVPIPMFF
ncbi:hypothetical protein FA95DRAFT_1684716 [Auriscalpium vulgare]|uniref:Uncharacterized protein n=1 Tax=Auriscalpium vulgare TaxID=40419 RepID=A0ACB8R248_9AGAM|nr:hypothetical protein FA95DRAFT_1684716 [Auriscalpium vulgare]